MRKNSLARLLALALTWAVIWAIPGGVIEAVQNVLPSLVPFASAIDMWPQTLAIPGFAGGLLFAALLPIAERRRRLEDVPLARVCLWGLVAGLLVGGLTWAVDYFRPVTIPLQVVMSVAAAAGSAWFFRLRGRMTPAAGARP